MRFGISPFLTPVLATLLSLVASTAFADEAVNPEAKPKPLHPAKAMAMACGGRAEGAECSFIGRSKLEQAGVCKTHGKASSAEWPALPAP